MARHVRCPSPLCPASQGDPIEVDDQVAVTSDGSIVTRPPLMCGRCGSSVVDVPRAPDAGD